MLSLIYVSSAATPFTQSQLHTLLTHCNASNKRDGITGMLLYKDGNFMQALEGVEATVRDTYARISRDPRHRGLIVLLESTIAERQFPSWSMGFRNLTAVANPVEGYSEFLNTPLTAEEFSATPKRAHVLLNSFKQNM